MKANVELDHILDVLIAHRVDCIVVGGVAAVVLGQNLVTREITGLRALGQA